MYITLGTCLRFSLWIGASVYDNIQLPTLYYFATKMFDSAVMNVDIYQKWWYKSVLRIKSIKSISCQIDRQRHITVLDLPYRPEQAHRHFGLKKV